MEPSLDTKLIECFDALEQGESVGQILARFPEDAESLRPVLDTAVRLSQFAPQPSLAAQAESRQKFLAQATVLAIEPRRRSPLLRFRALLLPLASLAFIFLFSAGLVAASSSAVPGAPLYSAKRFFEQVQLWLVTDPVGEEGLTDSFKSERIREIQLLLESGSASDVEFEGIVQQINANEWVIAGLATMVDGDTVINGVAEEGATVRVVARAAEGTLLARSITILASSPAPKPAESDGATRNNSDEPEAPTPASEDRDGHRTTPEATPETESQPEANPATPAQLPDPSPPTVPPAPDSSDGNDSDDHGDLNQNDDDSPDPSGDDSDDNANVNDNGANESDDNANSANDNDEGTNDNDDGANDNDDDNDNEDHDDEEDEEEEDNENRSGGG